MDCELSIEDVVVMRSGSPALVAAAAAAPAASPSSGGDWHLTGLAAGSAWLGVVVGAPAEHTIRVRQLKALSSERGCRMNGVVQMAKLGARASGAIAVRTPIRAHACRVSVSAAVTVTAAIEDGALCALRARARALSLGVDRIMGADRRFRRFASRLAAARASRQRGAQGAPHCAWLAHAQPTLPEAEDGSALVRAGVAPSTPLPYCMP